MYTLEELKRQNREIADLISVLTVLKDHHELRGNPFVCDLFASFNEKVWMHLEFEDDTLYSEMARHHNPEISSIARNFHETARKVKRHFTHYVKLWCQAADGNCDPETFSIESAKVFDLIRERIRYETEEMFPLVEKHF